MKYFIVVSLNILVLAGSMNLFAQGQQGSPRDDIAEQNKLADLSVEFMNAVEQKDQATLERLAADDFFVASPGDLTALPRAEWIANSLSMSWTNLKFHDLRVNIYGDTAVVTSVLDFKASGGKVPFPISSDAQIVDVWKKNNGQWQITARHLGAYSIGSYFRLIAGFAAGLILCFLIWSLLRIRRRFAARKQLAAA